MTKREFIIDSTPIVLISLGYGPNMFVGRGAHDICAIGDRVEDVSINDVVKGFHKKANRNFRHCVINIFANRKWLDAAPDGAAE